MSHEIVERGPLQLTGLAVECPGFDTSGIPALWERFIPRLGEVLECRGVWGASLPAANGFRYLAGAEVADSGSAPADFESVQVPGGRYLKTVFHDHVSKMSAEFQRMFHEVLPALGLQVQPGFCCLEEYLHEEGSQDAPGVMKVNLYLELK